MRAHIIIPDELAEQVDKIVGSRQRSEFIANAIKKELKHLQLLSAAKSAAGSLKDEDIPGWETSESAALWVHNLRRASDKRFSKK